MRNTVVRAAAYAMGLPIALACFIGCSPRLPQNVKPQPAVRSPIVKSSAKRTYSGSFMIDLGTIRGDGTRPDVGEAQAIRWLASAIKASDTAEFVITWTSVYPQAGYPDESFFEMITYDREEEKLMRELDSTTEIYSHVTPVVLRALAAHSETTLGLPKRGCPMTYE